jgi:uncharacterized protein YndB with AHSA1/START domain
MKTETIPLALQLDLRHTFDAPIERVFAAWTDLTKFDSWLGGKDNGCNQRKPATGEIRVGGVCRLEGADPNNPFAIEIKYREIVPHSRIVFTWTVYPLSDGCDGETTVTVNFVTVGKKTEVHLVHQGFASDESLAKHTKGWTSSMDSLSEKLA